MKLLTWRLQIALILLIFADVSSAATRPRTFTLIQLNDVYEIFPVSTIVDHTVQLRGGLAYAGTLIEEQRKKGPVLVLHAGDFLSPSLLSNKFKHKGSQMIDAMNAMKIDWATFGNHEFDFGCDVLAERIKQSKFGWISANVKLPSAMKLPPDKVRPYRIVTLNGIRIGIFALTVQLEPVTGCGETPITFTDPVGAARNMVAVLNHQKVDLIIALTHLRIAQDRELATEFPDIDFIVGGHDHERMVEVAGSTLITKAGSDAHDLGLIGVKAVRTEDGWVVEKHWSTEAVDPSKIKPLPAVNAALQPYFEELKTLNEAIGRTEVALDVRELTVRERESNFGNCITDLARKEMGTDVALINGGAFRGDRIVPPGAVTLNDLYTIFLFENQLRAISITGQQLIEALENGVSLIGEEAGRFPQVSGIRFMYDPEKAPGRRVTNVFVDGAPIDPVKTYSMATIDFLVERGFIDGYQFPKTNVRTGGNLIDLVIRDLKQTPFTCKVEGRIIQE